MNNESVTSEQWENLHNPLKNKTSISVTNFIQFLGFGYASRNELFNPIKKERNEHVQRAMDHGNKYEGEAIEYLKEKVFPSPRYECFSFKKKHIMKHRSIPIFGTVDLYAYDTERKEIIIVEIKCPYGGFSQRGNFDILLLEDEFEEQEKNWKHWVQLQLYLWIHQPTVTRGLLVYFYKKAGESGEDVLLLNFIEYEDDLETLLSIKENFDSFIEYTKRDKYKQERNIPKVKTLSTDLITRGITQRARIQILARSTKENP